MAPAWSGTAMKDPNNYFTDKHLKDLFAVVDNIRDRVLFLTLLYSGRRVSEVVRSLKPADINFEKGFVVWNILKRKKPTQAAKQEKRHLLDALKQLIEIKGIKEDAFIFPISRRRVNQLLVKWGDKAGIPRKRCHVHAFRHTLASIIMELTNRIDEVQRKLEHSSITVTAGYLHFSKREAEIVEEIPIYG